MTYTCATTHLRIGNPSSLDRSIAASPRRSCWILSRVSVGDTALSGKLNVVIGFYTRADFSSIGLLMKLISNAH